GAPSDHRELGSARAPRARLAPVPRPDRVPRAHGLPGEAAEGLRKERSEPDGAVRAAGAVRIPGGRRRNDHGRVSLVEHSRQLHRGPKRTERPAGPVARRAPPRGPRSASLAPGDLEPRLVDTSRRADYTEKTQCRLPVLPPTPVDEARPSIPTVARSFRTDTALTRRTGISRPASCRPSSRRGRR